MTDIHDQAQAFAVGALPASEAAEFEAHLDSCRACRREVAAMLDVTYALSESVADDPPPGLRAALLDEIARTPQDHSDGQVAAPEIPSNVVPLRRSRATLVSSLVAAAAVVAAIAFGGVALQNHQDATDATAQSDRLTHLLNADDVQTVQGESDADHTGAIVMSKSQGEAVFVASELPDPPKDHVYEAWTIEDGGNPAPAGTFSPHGSKSVVELPEAAFQANRMAITVEPDGGSDSPTSAAVLTFDMPQA